MRGVRIDFSGRRPDAPGWSLALLALGIIVCISAVWRLSDLAMREARAAGDVHRAQAALARRRPVPAAPVVLAEARVAAINSAITQLNLPWQPLFQCLEGVKPQNVALLGLEPDGKKRVLRILAETKQPEDMLAFVQMIRAQPQLADATLIKHETNLQDPNRPIRFVVEAVWKATL
jgi:hypothetical protein